MTTTLVSENPVVKVHKNGNFSPDGIVTLSTGIKARILPVSASLIEEVTSRIPDPEIPMYYNDNKEREEPNPSDPKYVVGLAKATKVRGQAAMDAMIMFGLELVDPVPSDTKWIWKLKRTGIEFDTNDEFEKEFAYKKYVACGNKDMMEIGRKAGINKEAIDEASKKF